MKRALLALSLMGINGLSIAEPANSYACRLSVFSATKTAQQTIAVDNFGSQTVSFSGIKAEIIYTFNRLFVRLSQEGKPFPYSYGQASGASPEGVLATLATAPGTASSVQCVKKD